MSRLPETLVNIPALMSFTIADLSHLEQLSDEALTARLESKEIDASGSRQQQMARVALLVLHKKGDISADPASSITTSANASSNASKNRKKKLNKKRKIEQSKVPFESTPSVTIYHSTFLNYFVKSSMTLLTLLIFLNIGSQSNSCLDSSFLFFTQSHFKSTPL